MVIVDDGSSDSTAAIGSSFGESMPIRLVRHKVHPGLGAAMVFSQPASWPIHGTSSSPSMGQRRVSPDHVAAALDALIAIATWMAFDPDLVSAHDGQHFAALANDPLLLDSPSLDYVP